MGYEGVQWGMIRCNAVGYSGRFANNQKRSNGKGLPKTIRKRGGFLLEPQKKAGEKPRRKLTRKLEKKVNGRSERLEDLLGFGTPGAGGVAVPLNCFPCFAAFA